MMDNGSDRKDLDEKKCKDCGTIKDDVRIRDCPYAEEIHDMILKVYICDNCFHERAMDI